MKRLLYPVTALLIISASAFTVYKAQNWKIGENYSVKFTSKDPSGTFSGLKGNVVFDEKNLAASKFDVSIDVATINTGNGGQNNHAKSEQWFDAEKYPQIKFTSSAITKTAAGYEAKGILDIHGVQKEAIIPFTFQNNTFVGRFDVNRKDFNINPSNTKTADVLAVDLSIPVTK
ncbi:MAG: YceI family protein [Chitinophagaceae bacterium]|nr:YceI family protein [Chitinophagaceae bacterium]